MLLRLGEGATSPPAPAYQRQAKKLISVARSDADVTDSAKGLVEKNLNWNFSVNVLDNMFYALAISLVSQETIMPLLVNELTDSTIAVGLIPAIFSLSFLLPQLFVANHAERLPRKLPFVLLGSGLLQRLPYPLDWLGAAAIRR